jgi:signal transduction histidine kinase/ActR/RegA family two-component response regulator
MNLKQRTFFFVTLSAAGLLVIYLGFSNYYIHQQEKQFLDGRLETTRTVAREFDEFFSRGFSKLDMISQLPGLAYGLHSLEADREGKQIPAWTTLHYLSYKSDVFTNGIHLLNKQGQILWSEPPDVGQLEAPYEPYGHILNVMKGENSEAAMTTWKKRDIANILLASRIRDDDGEFVGMLVGAIPIDHPQVQAILQRKPGGHVIAQLVDAGGTVVASTDPARQFQALPYWRPFSPQEDSTVRKEKRSSGETIVATSALAPSLASPAWMISMDQDGAEALSPISALKWLLAGFGFVIMAIAVCSLLFILRSFTKPVESLTTAARQIAEGDLDVRFSLDRSDEIGELAKTLDDMKTKVKSSYDMLLASEKMALMGQIVSGIAHELNNPLTVVLGNTQLLLMRNHDNADVEALKRVGESAERASKIVRNLLSFARQDSSERRLTDVNAVITKTLELHGYELRVRDISVELDLQRSLPTTMADASQLQQVFLNLIVNAEHAMIDSNGKGRLYIRTRTEGSAIRAEFSDDGPGISDEIKGRIFEPFFTTKAVGKGTGLGLSICQNIIQEHGGRIEVKSALGVGTTFVVLIPVQKHSALEEESQPAPQETRVVRKRILVVEDDAAIRQLFTESLSSDGHSVETVDSGVAALQSLGLYEYDLIFSDIKMPKLSGMDFYNALKSQGRGMEQRVVFVTGDLINPDTRQFLESTGCSWLGKPFDITAIKRIAAAPQPDVSEIKTPLLG